MRLILIFDKIDNSYHETTTDFLTGLTTLIMRLMLIFDRIDNSYHETNTDF